MTPLTAAELGRLADELEASSDPFVANRHVIAALRQAAAQCKDAERWRFIRQYISIEDVEEIVGGMPIGHIPDEVENVRADTAIDIAIKESAK